MKRSREPDEAPPDPTSPSPPQSSGSVNISGDEATSPPASKIIELDPSALVGTTVEMRCALPPHSESLVFATYDEYEAHYFKTHTNRCVECRKNFPSAHLLSVHIEEMHDSFVLVKRERGERTYSCFVEECERKCSTPQKRRMHLVDKHGYPRNFFFGVTKDGIDGRRSLLLEGGGHRRRRSSIVIAVASKKAPASSEAPAGTSSGVDDTDVAAIRQAAGHSEQPDANQKPDVEMDDLAGAMSALKFVPPSVRFGRGGKRAGFAKR